MVLLLVERSYPFGGFGRCVDIGRLSLLNFSNGSSLAFTGVLPYAYGNDSSVALDHRGSYSAVAGFDQLADLDGVVLGLVALSMLRWPSPMKTNGPCSCFQVQVLTEKIRLPWSL